MNNNDTFSKFIMKGDYSTENIENIKEYYNVSDKQLVRKTFKYLNSEIGIIQDNSFFEMAITNAVNFLYLICSKIEFNEEEVIINRKRIKKSREALLANANKFKNTVFMEAANKFDEIILDKNINLEDLKKLLIKLIEKKEDINIIKKLLNTNKGVLILDENTLFSYVFDLSLKSIKNNNSDVYYYISLLKIFYSSNINKMEYIKKLNSVTDDQNEFANEIYMIILGVKRGLQPEEILNKYGIITDFSTPYIINNEEKKYDEIIITIDGEKTKLRDDALSIKKDGNNYIVGIHIADPTSQIKLNSPEDIIARNNFKCIYMPGGGVRLISNTLENELTLDENKTRNTISMYVVIDNTGTIIDYYIMENIINITSNLSYNQSNNLFHEYDKYLSNTLKNLYEVACLLEKENPSKKTYWYKKDTSSLDSKIFESKSDKIIAELMVLYNRLIATIMCEECNPYVYRIQDPSYITSLVKKMNIEIDDSTRKTIEDIYMDSKYSTYPRYHNGLHVPIYSHSTDSLRRYPDLYNLYLLHAFHFKNINFNFNQERFEDLVSYFNQRNVELSLMESEYERALKLRKIKN